MVKMKRGWLRILVGATIVTCILLYFKIHYQYTSESKSKFVEASQFTIEKKKKNVDRFLESNLQVAGKGQKLPIEGCTIHDAPKTTISTVEQLLKFDFQPAWLRSREFWDTNFEEQYLESQNTVDSKNLKVFLMPHSHNDPGWLQTVEQYYFQKTSHILSNMVEKMIKNQKMTFVWAEVCFLALWYERVHPKLREQLITLIRSGRLEIVTGGWVMTDEASPDTYAILTQLIQGHQWLFNNLGVKPKSGWTIDTFGHGSAVPYILKESGITGTVIQRIHYAWKAWLAEKKSDDFMWRQTWDSTGETDILTHNRPYDIYSIKHSCGPHPQICLNFDFRKIQGEITEYSLKAANINPSNIEKKAELLIEQYSRTGFLFPHNVVLVPIGDDFRYDQAEEWDQQYENYEKLMKWINDRKSKYGMEIEWGTLKDYFSEVRKRMDSLPLSPLPTLQGDFFVYSDIFSSGRPAYWSGYFSTRPYWKALSRNLEATLHSADLMYAWAFNYFSNSRHDYVKNILLKDYEKLDSSRRHLSLFQHHDAITGTSKSFVMHDYGSKLHEGIRQANRIVSHAALALVSTEHTLSNLKSSSFDHLQLSLQSPSYEKLPKLVPVTFEKQQRLVVLTNALAQRQVKIVKLLVSTVNVRVTDEHGHEIPHQINPSWYKNKDKMLINDNQYELLFVADLAPLSLITYTIHRIKTNNTHNSLALIYTSDKEATQGSRISKLKFDVREVPPGDIQLANEKLELIFDGLNGLLRTVTDKRTRKKTQFMMKYAAYPSAQFNSGAYLFKPDPNAPNAEEDVLAGAKVRIFIQSGPIASELTVMFGFVLHHSFKIYHVENEPLASAIYMENSFDFSGVYNTSDTPGFSPNFRETEMFFRFSTDIDNGKFSRFYTDQNGVGMQERTRVDEIGIQGNYYPITTATFMEDESRRDLSTRRRITLLVDRAAAAASWKTGYLETMVERKMIYDDSRGMGEGVTDQKRTLGRYWLLLENLEGSEKVPQLSLAAHYLSTILNRPSISLILENLESDSLKPVVHLINKPFPCPVHLLSVYTLPAQTDSNLTPSNKALFTLQHKSPSCTAVSSVGSCRGINGTLLPDTDFTLPVLNMRKTSLTGTEIFEEFSRLSDFKIEHHRLKSFVVTFK